MRYMRFLPINSGLIISTALILSACDPASSSVSGISFPKDAQIVAALDAQLKDDPNSAAARELVQTLGGEQGKLKYTIHRVIYRESAYEVHYDAALVMAQPGEQSLRSIYQAMIPDEEKSTLADDSLGSYSTWLKNHAESLEKDPAQQANGQALATTLASLEECYANAKAGDEVVVMQGLGAQLLPERQGLYAEKLPMPATTVRCLPL